MIRLITIFILLNVKVFAQNCDKVNLLNVVYINNRNIILELDKINPSFAENINNFEINHQNPISSKILYHQNKIWLSLASDFVSASQLKISNIRNQDNLELPNILTNSYPLVSPNKELVDIQIINRNTLVLEFAHPQALPAANTVSIGTNNANIISYYENNKNKILLQYQRNFTAANSLSNFINAPNFYKTFEIIQINSINSRCIEVIFDRSIDRISANIASNYEIIGFGTPKEVNIESNYSVKLYFDKDIDEEKYYDLRCRNIKNKSLFQSISQSFSFYFDLSPAKVLELFSFADKEIRVVFSDSLRIANKEIFRLGNQNASNFIYKDGFLQLSFPNSVQNSFLTICPIVNVAGITQNNIQHFRFEKLPNINKVYPISPNTLEIIFSENMPPSINQVQNYEIIGLGKAINIVGNNNIRQVTFASNFEDKKAYHLRTENITNSSGTPLQKQNFSFIYQHFIREITVNSPNFADIVYAPNILDTQLNLNNNFITIQGLSHITVNQNATNRNIIHLYFSTALEENKDYFITINAIPTAGSNYIPASFHKIIYENNPPKLLKINILALDELELIFSQELDKITAEAPNHYNIILGISSIKLGTDKKTIQIKLKNKLQENIIYSLGLKNIQNLKNQNILPTQHNIELPISPKWNELRFSEIMADPSPKIRLPEVEYIEIFNNSEHTQDLSTVFFADVTSSVRLNGKILPKSYMVLCPKNNVDEFNFSNILALDKWITLTNSGKTIYLKNLNNQVVDSVSYKDTWYKDTKKKDGGYSLEIINFKGNCTDEDNWIASTDLTGGTPSRQNSVFENSPDKTPPTLQSYILDNEILTLNFSENTTLTAEPKNFRLNKVSIDKIELINKKQIKIIIKNIQEGEIYELHMDNVADCWGNSQNISLKFGKGKKAKKNDIIISEIMANEKPSRGLPEAEYLEIFNTQDYAIDLTDLLLSDNTSTSKLGSYTIPAKSYLLLTSTTKSSLFKDIPVLGVVGFPSLNNTGERLVLSDTLGNIIFEVEYSDKWYGDEEKKKGGYSLEYVLYYEFCGGTTLWAASESTIGGTPAAPNSAKIKSDLIFPKLSYFEADSNIVILRFDKKIDTETMLNLQNYSLSTQKIEFIKENEVKLYLQNLLIDENILKISGLRDCFGNTLDTTIHISRGRSPQANEILITEIMANEKPSVGLPEAEYIEIYNNTNNNLSLQGLILEDNTTKTSLPSYILLPKEYILLCATSKSANFSKAIAVPNFPTLNNTGETITLKNQNGKIIFSVSYKDTWYKDERKKNGGYSLEMIDINNLCGEENNWEASKNPLGGTPSALNSVSRVNIDDKAPEIESLTFLNDSIVELIFNENIDTLLASKNHNYFIENKNIIQIIVKSQKIIWLKSHFERGKTYHIEISQIKDCTGNTMLKTQKSVFLPKKAIINEILITEIMFDPNPSAGLPEYEYLELYNNSTNIIELSHFQILVNNKAYNLPNFVLNPNNYLIISTKLGAEAFKNIFPDRNILAMSNFPALPNEGADVEIRHQENSIFQIRYSPLQHINTKKDGGFSLEMIDFEALCLENKNWTSSTNPIGGTPAAPNSIKDWAFESPQVLDFQVDRQINIVFSMPMDTTSLLIEIVPNIKINKKYWESTKNLVLEIDTILPNINYQINLLQLKNCLQNTQKEISLRFGKGQKARFQEISITEIMANPENSVGLPNFEYVEICNISDKILNLEKIILNNEKTSVEVPNFQLFSGEFALLCPAAGVEEFRRILPKAKIIGLPRWLTIYNDKGKVIFLDSEGKLITQNYYEKSYYKDNKKADGGWALEKRDIYNFCAEGNNWEASQNQRGGTPAQENSVKMQILDTKSPNLVTIFTKSQNEIIIVFDEKLDSLFLDKIEIEFGIAIVKVQYFSEKEILLVLKSNLEKNIKYEIKVRNFKDCSGNIQVHWQNKELIVAEDGEIGDLCINEILFNPPTNGVDFVELYNKSDKYINLENWKMSNSDKSKTYKITNSFFILPPKNYIVITSSLEKLQQQYPKLQERWVITNSLPSLNDKNGTFVLYSPKNDIDSFYYEEKMHFPLISDVEGVSLERINPEKSTQDLQNWHSAASPDFGTPTFKNSQSMDKQSANNACISLSNEVITPDGDGFQDFTFLNFNCLANGKTMNIRIFDAEGREILHLVKNALVGNSQEIRWDGTDETGRKVRVGYYIFWIEIFNLSGSREEIQKKIVVGAKF